MSKLRNWLRPVGSGEALRSRAVRFPLSKPARFTKIATFGYYFSRLPIVKYSSHIFRFSFADLQYRSQTLR